MRPPPPPLLSLLLLAACITPPAVQEGGSDRIHLPMYPPGSEEVAVGPLRGVFTPAEPGAPVVVHLLGSGGSIAEFYASGLLYALRDRGLASLAVDYQGVGASGGRRSPNNLRGDARAAYEEAVRRAGGPARVVVRGTSIGTLAAGGLLEEGAGAAAVVLFSPVRGETVARHWLYANWWDPFAFLLAPFLKPTTDVDLVAALRGARAPLLVVAPEEDSLLPAAEMRLVEEAAVAAGGTFVRKDEGHLGVAVMAFEVVPEEEELYRRLFPETPPVGVRMTEALERVPADADVREDALRALVRRRLLDPPVLAPALVAARTDVEAKGVLRWLRALDKAELGALPFGELRALVDFRDPAGALDPRELYALRGLVRKTFAGGRPSPKSLVALAVVENLADNATYETEMFAGLEVFGPVAVGTMTVHRDEAPHFDAPARLQLTPAESFRQSVRLLLKASGIPDRHGARGLEAWLDGRWEKVDLTASPAGG